MEPVAPVAPRYRASSAGGLISPSWVLGACCGLYGVGFAAYTFPALGPVRYAVYTIPVALVVLMAADRNWKYRKAAACLLLAYVWAGSVYWLGGGITLFFRDEFVIISLILICFVPKLRITMAQIRLVFAISLGCFAASYANADLGKIRLLTMIQAGSGSGLDAGFDSNEGGLVGPIYAVFFALAGTKLELLAGLGISLVGGKRIGLIAVVCGIVAAKLMVRSRLCCRATGRAVFLVLITGGIGVAACNSIALAQSAYSILGLRVGIEEVMLGRYAIGSEVTRIIDTRDATDWLTGGGAGAANDIATLVSDGGLKEPHNDWLKILYDYGAIGFVIFVIGFSLVMSGSVIMSGLAVTTAVIMTTDNVLIYFFYQWPLVMILNWSEAEDSGA